MNLDILGRLACRRDPQENARRLRSVLGEFARFALRPEYSDGRVPVIPLEWGCTGAFFVWKQEKLDGKPQLAELLQASFFLPLRWKPNTSDSKRLPIGLAELAGQVRDCLACERGVDETSKKAIGSHGLHLDERLGGLDLSNFPFTVNSAWAPLAAGLIVAIYGGRPSRGVFATGAWNGGISQVEGIREKIDAAIALAGSGVRVFVPADNFKEAKRCAGTRASVESLPSGGDSASQSLLSYLQALAAPPSSSAHATLTERCDYANQDFVIADRDTRVRYYQRELLADLAEDLAKKSGSSFGVRRLALGLSLNWDVDALLIRALKPAEVLLLGSKESIRLEKVLRENLQDHPTIKIIPPLELTEDNAGARCDEIAAWLEKDSSETAVDITAATKDMSSVLLIAARRSNARVLYLRHKTRGPAPLYGNGSLTSLDWALK